MIEVVTEYAADAFKEIRDETIQGAPDIHHWLLDKGSDTKACLRDRMLDQCPIPIISATFKAPWVIYAITWRDRYYWVKGKVKR